MITFHPSDHIKAFIIERGKEANLPGMGGGIIDARPHINKLIESLYADSWVFAELAPGPVVDSVLRQIGAGVQANVGNVAFFPPDEVSKASVIESGTKAKIPGMGGGLFDSRKYVTFAVTKLAEHGYRLVYLMNTSETQQIWNRLDNQLAAEIPEW